MAMGSALHELNSTLTLKQEGASYIYLHRHPTLVISEKPLHRDYILTPQSLSIMTPPGCPRLGPLHRGQ